MEYEKKLDENAVDYFEDRLRSNLEFDYQRCSYNKLDWDIQGYLSYYNGERFYIAIRDFIRKNIAGDLMNAKYSVLDARKTSFNLKTITNEFEKIKKYEVKGSKLGEIEIHRRYKYGFLGLLKNVMDPYESAKFSQWSFKKEFYAQTIPYERCLDPYTELLIADCESLKEYIERKDKFR
ncbi:TPA: hypothetical protein HA235_01325 [Candidatus Woesearchaeota archaeon]|nr:hypothetical protein [Candidatus Woesearchaeota archaeon]HIH31324.1 hypothetical protein [Candidatus Woesearchaeota archaeon]HIH55385.1 hypothetical protein [Candidatus Woesearchaeota archaeon]HIJ01577.1 hypothetical protein [Candidatus Woesearchaeota archaeon]HIJ14576.1 hypothetical protein [Candidatus Woesearchaeota archaeon]